MIVQSTGPLSDVNSKYHNFCSICRDFNVYTLKILGFVWFFWIFWTFLIFVLFDWNLVKWSSQLQKKRFLSKFGQIWTKNDKKLKFLTNSKKFEKNLKFWWYERWNRIKIDCCTAKQSWLVKPSNFTKPHFFIKNCICFNQVTYLFR